MLHVIHPKSLYHPYSKNYKSTLTDKVASRSPLSKAFSEPLRFTRAPIASKKSEWDFDELSFNGGQKDAVDYLDHELEKGDQFMVYIGGPAGTGKSVVLKHFAEQVRRKYGFREACEIAAPIGLAAINVGGVTIHSLLNIFPGQMPFVRLNQSTAERLYQALRRLKVLILDEISMVAALLLAQVDHRLQEVFNNTSPFGGISIVVFGDLLQLPPVPSNSKFGSDEDTASKFGDPEYIFTRIPARYVALRDTVTPTSPKNLWRLFKMVELQENVRARKSMDGKMLARVRLGECSDEVRGYLHHHCRMVGTEPKDVMRELRYLENEEPEKFFMVLARTRQQVDEINQWRFESSTKNVSLEPVPVAPTDVATYPLRGKREVLKLVVGCKVMVTANLKKDALANGVLGRLTSVTREHANFKRFDNGKMVHLSRQLYTNGTQFWSQFPLTMAEAITVHKSQGMTFEGVVVVTDKMYHSCHGSFYTAISRARELRKCRITSIETVKWSVCPRSLHELENLRRRTSAD